MSDLSAKPGSRARFSAVTPQFLPLLLALTSRPTPQAHPSHPTLEVRTERGRGEMYEGGASARRGPSSNLNSSALALS